MKIQIFSSFLLCVLFCFQTSSLKGKSEQQAELIAEPVRDSLSFFAGYPLVFYLPETRLGFAAAGVYTFRSQHSTGNSASNLQALLGYTLNKQLLIFTSYSIFRKENRHFFGGELGYYDYFYPFYGVGNETKLASEEDFFVKFPRLKSKYLIKNSYGFYLGPTLHLEDYNIFKTQPNGILDNQLVNGSNGSRLFGLGLSGLTDKRNVQFYPSKGYFIDASLLYYRVAYDSSNIDYFRFSLSYSHYLSIKENLIVAFNLFQEVVGENAPLQEKALYGGPKYARGYVIGRFRDNLQTVVQSELRFSLFWRLKGVAFLSVGNVGENVRDLKNNIKATYGAGLRVLLSKEEQLHIRIDYGRSREGGNFYVTIGEAF